jgi:hypothetical protein
MLCLQLHKGDLQPIAPSAYRKMFVLGWFIYEQMDVVLAIKLKLRAK